MGFLDLFRKKPPQEAAKPDSQPTVTEDPDVYSGMRVEATTLDGRMLFGAKLTGPQGQTAELYQYTEFDPPQDMGPTRVSIRGYNDHKRKAVYMEGVISPKPHHIWRVEELTVVRAGNDRAFFRLDTNLDATITLFGGFGAGEKDCKLLNISVGGVCVGMEHQLHLSDKFLLKVKLLEDRDLSVMFCEVLRIVDKGDSKYEYGCRFVELNDADQDRIGQTIFAAQIKERKGR